MKKIRSFDVYMGFLLAVLALTAVGLGWMLERRAITVTGCPQQPIGINGPLRLDFTRPVQSDTVERHLRFTPALKGKFVWQNNSLLFWPEKPLEAGAVYQLELLSGVMSAEGRPVSPVTDCKINVRPLRIVYEAVSAVKGQLLSVNPDGKNGSILADFEGEILSFDVAPDGNEIILAVQNEAGGSDIWLVGREGSPKRKLIDCGGDHCTDALWLPDNARIIYNQTGNTTQTWLFDTLTRVKSTLFKKPNMQGVSYHFSPDGKKLAFFDALSGGVRIVDLETEETLLLKSNSALMSWSPDSERIIYFNQVQENQQTYVNALLYSFNTRQSTVMLDEYHDQFEFGEPVWTPDGEWITLSVRLARTKGSPTRQLALIKPDGSAVKMITEDQMFTQSAYHWSPDGRRLVFQRYKLGASDSQPEIVVWDAGTETSTALPGGGSRPTWLP